MPRVMHFEINAEDPERAISFYTDVFGWKIKKWEGPTDYWLVTTGPDDQPGINGGIARREDSSQPTVNTVGVSSQEEYAEKIVAMGGKQLTPKITIPGVGYMGYFADTEGNTFGIIEPDESAK